MTTTIGHTTNDSIHATAAYAIETVAANGYAVIKYHHSDGTSTDFLLRGHKRYEGDDTDLRGDWYEMHSLRNGVDADGHYEPGEGSRVSLNAPRDGDRVVSWSSGNGSPLLTTFPIEFLSAIKTLRDANNKEA